MQLSDQPVEGREYEQLGLVPIIADGAHFVSALKSVLVARLMMFPDEIRGLIRIALRYIGDLHGEFPERFDQRRQPLAILTAAYQDGLIHALQRLDSKYNAGESDPHRLHHRIRSYEALRRDKLRHRDYFNVAYIDGYIIGLTYPFVAWEDPRVKPPAYYIYGAGPIEGLGEYREALRTAKERYPRVQGAAKAIAHELPPNSGITEHHFPFL